MVFGQLANRESLSDLVTCLHTQREKWYHLGLGSAISKSNLAHANEDRNWRIYADFAYLLIARARIACKADFEMEMGGTVYDVDSTTIDICLGVFWWAKFRKQKAAIKLPTQFAVKTDLPHFVHFTDSSVHGVNVMDLLVYEAGSFYIFDRCTWIFGGSTIYTNSWHGL